MQSLTPSKSLCKEQNKPGFIACSGGVRLKGVFSSSASVSFDVVLSTL